MLFTSARRKLEEGDVLSLEERALGAYLGLAVGDALGATTEFLTPREITEQYGTHDKICGGGWLHLKAGQVTDDTEMSLALGQSIIEKGEVQAQAVAEAFSEWMRSKPIDIGNTVRRGVVHFRNSGVPWVEENEYDAGNGACMRTLPVALRYWNSDSDTLAHFSRVQSHVTHNNPQADAGTEAVLRMLAAAFKGETKSTLKEIADELVDQHKPYRFDKRRAENPSGWIVHTLKAVFQAFFEHDNFKSILVDVVNRGGDADTTGAIAGMLAGALYGVDAIPNQWIKAIDRKVKKSCEDQTKQLLALANSG